MNPLTKQIILVALIYLAEVIFFSLSSFYLYREMLLEFTVISCMIFTGNLFLQRRGINIKKGYVSLSLIVISVAFVMIYKRGDLSKLEIVKMEHYGIYLIQILILYIQILVLFLRPRKSSSFKK